MKWISAHFEEVLTFFFKTYKPQYLDKVPEFLEEFKGQELKCIQLLCSRYFVDFERFVSKTKVSLNLDPEKIAEIEASYASSSNEEVTSEEENTEKAEEHVLEEEIEVKKKSKLPLIIILLVVLLGGGAAYYFLFMGAEEKEPSSAATEMMEEIKEELNQPAITDTTVSMDSIQMDSLTIDSMALDSMNIEAPDTLNNDSL